MSLTRRTGAPFGPARLVYRGHTTHRCNSRLPITQSAKFRTARYSRWSSCCPSRFVSRQSMTRRRLLAFTRRGEHPDEQPRSGRPPALGRFLGRRALAALPRPRSTARAHRAWSDPLGREQKRPQLGAVKAAGDVGVDLGSADLLGRVEAIRPSMWAKRSADRQPRRCSDIELDVGSGRRQEGSSRTRTRRERSSVPTPAPLRRSRPRSARVPPGGKPWRPRRRVPRRGRTPCRSSRQPSS